MTMARPLTRWMILLALVPALLPRQAAAQEQPPPVQQRPDSAVLVFEREVFFYPQYERRNPFRSLASGRESGPRFEEVALIGIVFSPNPDLSMAVLGPRAQGGGGEQQGPALTFRVRRGDSLGNFRILEIQPTRVVVEVEEFGLTEQRIMELRRPGQGGLE